MNKWHAGTHEGTQDASLVSQRRSLPSASLPLRSCCSPKPPKPGVLPTHPSVICHPSIHPPPTIRPS